MLFVVKCNGWMRKVGFMLVRISASFEITFTLVSCTVSILRSQNRLQVCEN